MSSSTDNELASLTERHFALFESGDYHDFVLTCGKKEFQIHRSIVCPQSSVLKVMCDGNWKVCAGTSVTEVGSDDVTGMQRVQSIVGCATHRLC